MLSKEMVLKLYDYNYWANKRILDSASKVGEDELNAATECGDRPLLETLFHMLSTEWVWRNLSQHHQIDPASIPQREALPTVDAIKDRWQEEEQSMRAFISN